MVIPLSVPVQMKVPPGICTLLLFLINGMIENAALTVVDVPIQIGEVTVLPVVDPVRIDL